MTLVTSPGDPTADSYASLDEADAYFTARGNAAWTGDDPTKENALRRGAAYLDNQYRTNWVGVRTNLTQSLAWPRGDGLRSLWRVSLLYPILDVDGFAIATDVVPAQIKSANIEAALLVLTGTILEPTLVRGGRVKSTTDTVGPISETVVYEDGASSIDRYLVIEGILRGLVTATPGAANSSARVVRA